MPNQWFFGTISSCEAESLLHNEGDFLIRISPSSGCYALAVRYNCPRPGVAHIPIQRDPCGNYMISPCSRYRTLCDLVAYHRRCRGSLPTCLLSYPSAESSHSGSSHSGSSHSGSSHSGSRHSESRHSGSRHSESRHSESRHSESRHSESRHSGNSGQGGCSSQRSGSQKWEICSMSIRLGKILGEGSFGTVHYGTLPNGKEVAVKKMKPRAMSEEEFIKEGQIMTNLQHPNIVKCYGFCTDKRPIYIVSEYMKGGSLLSYLSQHRHNLMSNTQRLVSFCAQICAGMAYLESHHFVHRDLAARNCLVDGQTVKVADFGLTRYVHSDVYQGKTGAPFPIRWSPPEVLTNKKFTSKCDVWAFGVLMYEIFTCGGAPYGRMTDFQVMEYVKSGNILHPPETCGSRIASIMGMCFTYKDHQRPSFAKIQSLLG